MEHRCVICDAVTEPLINEKKSALFHQCPICQLILRDKSDYYTPDEEKNRYSLHQNSIDDKGYRDYFLRFFEETQIIKSQTNIPQKGLDYGSGPIPVLAYVAKQTYNIEMDCYDVFFSPQKVYTSKQYDFITCTEVIEHISKPLETFDLFREHLVDGGIVAMMTQLHNSDRDSFFSWFYIRDRSHVTFYSMKTMEYVAKKVGLKIEYTNHKNIVTFKK